MKSTPNFVSFKKKPKERYPVGFEIAGRYALYSDVASGDINTSLPFPTPSALIATAKTVAMLQSAIFVPTRIEICRPTKFHRIAQNYRGPARRPQQFTSNSAQQIYWQCLIDVCFKIYGFTARSFLKDTLISEKAFPYFGRDQNGAHAYQSIFLRRLGRGQRYNTPFMGMTDFPADYCGPIRIVEGREDEFFGDKNRYESDRPYHQNHPVETMNQTIPSVPLMKYNSFAYGSPSPRFAFNKEIVNGVVEFTQEELFGVEEEQMAHA
jgi:CRISPR-associated Cas5-like protein